MKLKPPKNLWQKLDTEITARAFSEDQICGHGNDSAHDTLFAYYERDIFNRKPSTIKDWQNSFTKITIKAYKTSSNLNP
jgi:hypothetical protein